MAHTADETNYTSRLENYKRSALSAGLENMTDSYMYAALLLHKAGKPINEENLTNVVKAAGVQAEQVRVKALASALSEINIDDALKNAASMAVAQAPAAAPAQAGGGAKVEEKKEEKKEEEALAGLASLFG